MREIYVHIPFCKSRCTYCAFVTGFPHSEMPLYVESLKKEINDRLISGDDISTVYIGGGTPSVLYRGAITDILDCIRSKAKLREDAEITVECNPDSVTPDFVSEITEAGVNRVSIGLQTTNDKLLKKVNRPHDLKGFIRAWELLGGIENKSVDLMLGLPRQTEEDLMHSLEFVKSISPKHISLYALKCEEGTPLFDTFVEDEDFEAELYDIAHNYLTESGYERYEVSNFALPNYHCRHNCGYWDLTEYYGFGISAHSLIDGKRFANDDNFYKYIVGTNPRFEEDFDPAEEYLMLGLRTKWGVDLRRLRFYGLDLERSNSKLDRLIRQGFLIREGDTIKLSPEAFYVMNIVIGELI